jgi:hypothetical protein
VCLLALALLYVGLVATYQRVIPLFEAPDEPSHIHYAVFVCREGRLPRYHIDLEVPGEGMQPPLYYAAAAAIACTLAPGDPMLLHELRLAGDWEYGPPESRRVLAGSRVRPIDFPDGIRHFDPEPRLEPLRSLRWATLPFGLLAVLLTASAAWRWSRSAPFSLLCGALLAFAPQFVFVSATVGNDPAASLIGAAALHLLVGARAGERVGRSQYLGAAALTALGAWVKLSTLPVVGVTAVFLFAIDPRGLREKGADALLAASAALLMLLPLAALNLARFGDPLGVAALVHSDTYLPRPADFGGLASYLTRMYWYGTLKSYWCVFGWLNVHAPWTVVGAYFALTALGASGFVLNSLERHRAGDRIAPTISLYLAAASLATLAAHVWLNTSVISPQGRHLFAAAPHVALLLASGIAYLSGRSALRIGWLAASMLAAALFGLAVFCALAVIAPAYR